MLGAESARQFKNILAIVSEIEMMIEHQRVSICEMAGFSPYSAFCRVDRNAQECITSEALMAFMQDNSTNCTIGDAAKVIRFFDSDGDGILSYNDFI